jgi:hypothetical protein
MRVNASRWAAVPPPAKPAHITLVPGEPGETCVLLANVRRCTYAIVWTASATLNREGTALALAVQPTHAWRELWIFRKSGGKWTVRILPPADNLSEVGYAEFAGWIPGGAQMLVAREAAAGNAHSRRFEVVRLDTLAAMRRASEPKALGAFERWKDASWAQHTLAVR